MRSIGDRGANVYRGSVSLFTFLISIRTFNGDSEREGEDERGDGRLS